MRCLFSLLLLTHAGAAMAADVIAHRGYGCGAPENSLQSIHNAWKSGADGVELDVRVSADGIAYLFHDDEIDGQLVDGMTFAEVDATTPRPLVPLTELGATPDAGDYYLLDLKSVNDRTLGVVLAAVRASGASGSQVNYQSHDLSVLRAVSSESPEARTYFLSRLEWRVPYLVPASARSLLKSLQNQGVDGVSIKGRSFVGRKFVDTLKGAGLTVKVWTINRLDRIDHYRRAGVDAIITDEVDPALGVSPACST